MDEELAQIQAHNLGTQFALMAAVSALIAAHPDPERLAEFLDVHQQTSLASLTTLPLPEQAMNAFHLVWEQLLPGP